MLKIMAAACALALATIATLPVAAASFDFADANGIRVVTMTGEVTEGDAKVFELIAKGQDSLILVLESKGGLLGPALTIGAMIRDRGYATMVGKKGFCVSACGLVWLGGAKRFMGDEAVIGLHAAYRERDGVKSESGIANARVGAYLTMLGLSLKVVDFATMADPDSISRLTPQKARELGIEIAERGSWPAPDAPSQPTRPTAPKPPLSADAGDAGGVKRDTFDRAVRNFRQVYQDAGLTGANDAIRKCYARAAQLKTADSAAYCVALDTLATAMDMAMAPEGAKDAISPFNKLAASLGRSARAAAEIGASESLAAWQKAAIQALSKANL